MSEEEEGKEKEKQRLTWRDYVAIVIAMLTTTLLPLVIFALILIAALFVALLVFT